jgi:hypothetical protein
MKIGNYTRPGSEGWASAFGSATPPIRTAVGSTYGGGGRENVLRVPVTELGHRCMFACSPDLAFFIGHVRLLRGLPDLI